MFSTLICCLLTLCHIDSALYTSILCYYLFYNCWRVSWRCYVLLPPHTAANVFLRKDSLITLVGLNGDLLHSENAAVWYIGSLEPFPRPWSHAGPQTLARWQSLLVWRCVWLVLALPWPWHLWRPECLLGYFWKDSYLILMVKPWCEGSRPELGKVPCTVSALTSLDIAAFSSALHPRPSAQSCSEPLPAGLWLNWTHSRVVAF